MPNAGATGGVAIAPVHGVPLFTCPARKSGPEYDARSATNGVPALAVQEGSALATDSRNVENR